MHCQRFLNICPSGGISANLVALVTIRADREVPNLFDSGSIAKWSPRTQSLLGSNPVGWALVVVMQYC